MAHRIGLAYIRGALPRFEMFGNLPTDLVCEDGLVDGKPASKVLDMIIIPGGSLVESQAVTNGIAKEIRDMAETGKFVLGICSGFQILSLGTDIGRLSPTPIFRSGMGLIDAKFKPLICTDQVRAKVVGSSALTDEVGAELTGFHCHTYGDIAIGKNANPILSSTVTRLNYFRDPKDITSGVSNRKGNVVGILPHALLDHNPAVIRGITKTLDISQAQIKNIRATNAKLQKKIQSELGIATCIKLMSPTAHQKKTRVLLVTAMESGGGKTVVVTGLAGALRKRGWNVGVVKVGGDIRDIVPALYLIKEPIRPYSSLYVADTGWETVPNVVKRIEADYDFVLVEGAMNAFTGILFDETKRPNSTAEIAATLGVPTVVVAGCDKEGIEGGIVSALGYVRLLKKIGVKTVGVILNKVYLNYISDETRTIMKKVFAKAGAEALGILPISDLEGRGVIPEVEIKYEEFTSKALSLIEGSVDVERVVKVAEPFAVTMPDYDGLVKRFKDAL